MQHALRQLAERVEVAIVAGECRHESVSASVSMFRQALWVSPGQYLRSASGCLPTIAGEKLPGSYRGIS